MEQTIAALPQMLDEEQVARVLAVSIAALRRWRREGRGPQFTRLERCVRYDVRAIEQFVAEHSSGNEARFNSTRVARPSSEVVSAGSTPLLEHRR
jgi:predicted site-specific integrase-resolvase